MYKIKASYSKSLFQNVYKPNNEMERKETTTDANLVVLLTEKKAIN